MKKIFIGAIFILFNYSLSIGNGSLGLIPDPVGFFLVWKGMRELVTGNGHLEKLSGFAGNVLIALVIATGVEYGLAIFGIKLLELENEVYSILWSILLIGFECYVWRIIVMIVQNLERAAGKDFNGKILSAAWWFYMITNVLVTVGSWNSDSFLLYAAAFNIVSMITFLVQLYKCQKMYTQK